VSVLKLPKAPSDYNINDQDFVRRIIMDKIRALEALIGSGGGGGGGGGTVTPISPFPVSPVIGVVSGAGSTSYPAFIQYLNPSGSGVQVQIFEMYLSIIVNGGSDAFRGWRTDSPVDLSSESPTTASLLRMDEEDVTTIHSILQSASTGGTIISEDDANFAVNAHDEGAAGWEMTPIILPMEAPLVVDEGSAVEFSAPVTGSDSSFRLYIKADEIAT
jgi:hypothetical protein